MSKVTIPLVGMPNQRNYDSLATLISNKDQRFIGGMIGVIPNQFTGTKKAYFEKRPGFETLLTPTSSKNGQLVFFSRSKNKFISAFNASSTTTLFVGTTSVGTTT